MIPFHSVFCLPVSIDILVQYTGYYIERRLETMKTKFDEQCITFSQINMIFNARLFWRRLTTWTRVYIISRYMGIGTSEEAFSRLYIENLNFGELLQIVFGRQIANQFSGLLNQYTIGIRELITAELQETPRP
jgi:hypothetical protein